MELKLSALENSKGVLSGINRTFMELKQVSLYLMLVV